jgi:hypothetical protein
MSNGFRYLTGNKKNEKLTIEKMLKDIDLYDYQKAYILERFIDILYDDFDVIAIKNKVVFQILRFTALISSILIPVIANLNDNLIIINQDKTSIITILGLLSTVSFGFLQIYKNEKVWLHHRETFEILRTEGYSFLNLSGEYGECNTHKKAFPQFSNNIESLIRKDISCYTQIIKKSENRNDSFES